MFGSFLAAGNISFATCEQRLMVHLSPTTKKKKKKKGEKREKRRERTRKKEAKQRWRRGWEVVGKQRENKKLPLD